MSRQDHFGMIKSRFDLTEWALHFVHDYDEANQPDHEAIHHPRCGSIPYHEDEQRNFDFESWEHSDAHYHLGADPSAMNVLRKIIFDGHIRASWAFRNGRPTIYGPRAAVCFTEMPLYALVDYAKRRRNESVHTYAIGVKKKELFAAGGRPVLYGLSGPHREAPSSSRMATET